MDTISVIGLFKEIEKDDLIFAYSGAVSDSISHRIIELTQYNIDSVGSFVKFKNKISFLMAECYQNVARHAKHSFDDVNYDLWSAFFVRSVDNTFYISSANAVNDSSIKIIKEKLDRVNNLNSDELRVLQKEVLAKGKLSERGGAGLGIIEMARKTGQGISFDFRTIDDTHSKFYLQLVLESQQDFTNNDNRRSLSDTASLHDQMLENNLIILHKGDFSENSILPIIQMIEKNLLDQIDPRLGKQKIFNISVELLQNISLHAYKENNQCDGLFLLGKKDDNYFIAASNYLEKSKVQSLTNQLEKLKKLTKPELNSLYREKLSELIDKNQEGNGIGLIYLFRKGTSLNYSISNDSKHPLLTIILEV